MASVSVKVEPEAGLPRREREQLVDTIQLFAELVGRIDRSELRVLHQDLATSNIGVVVADEHTPGVQSHPVTGRPPASPEERAFITFRSLLEFFRTRQQTIETETITAPQVAELLRVSRQTPLNRVKEGTMLAVLDRGAWRFPVWQFDPQGPDGVVPGLPEVLKALDPQKAFTKLVWLRRPNPTLGNRRPIELLGDGEVAPVVDVARAAAELP